MTKIVFDKLEDRTYETGVDRGVIYPATNDGSTPSAAWNGLVSVNESTPRESKEYFLEGRKVMERLVVSPFSGTVSAFTYPPELDAIMGVVEDGDSPGMFYHDQLDGKFHMTYRTKIGSALAGPDFAYKIHLLYNLKINPSDVARETIGEQLTPETFEWTLTSSFDKLQGFPVNRITFDSRTFDPAKLAQLENALYGEEESDPYIPDLELLLTGSFF
jgi:hypothetical protein